jgi:hypothetical protein
MNLELDDTERAGLVELLKGEIEGTRFPFAPRLRPLKSVLAKLAPQPPAPEPFPPPKPPTERSVVLAKKRRR